MLGSAATGIAAVLVLVLLSIPKLRWWERNGAREQEPVPSDGLEERPTGPGLSTRLLAEVVPDYGQQARRGGTEPARPPEPPALPEVTSPQPITRASGTIVP